MSAILDRVGGRIVAPDGGIVELPSVLISPTTAALMRRYFLWLMRAGLEPELVCDGCFAHSRESRATFDISEQQIVIVCGCRIRFFDGATLPPDPVTASVTVPGAADGVGQVQLSADAAGLLRLYKRVLGELGLKEALRCNTCYSLEQPDGCEAQVTTGSIRIRCRCSNRTYQGHTI